MKASFYRYFLNFKIPGGTSRGVLKQKETFFLLVETAGKWGIGECGIFRGLSYDDREGYEEKLRWLCNNISLEKDFLLRELQEFPSIQFGLEQALLSLNSPSGFDLFPSDFTRDKDSIPINGLIWMGSEEFMKDQIEKKLQEGFTTLKMKIGAIDFDAELSLLKRIRNRFNRSELELRVDANGAFHPNEALRKLEVLSRLQIHSIEQPIKAGQIETMHNLCRLTPLPIALDEELIGVVPIEDKKKLIDAIQPQFIILKPSLIGGFKGSEDWIGLAEDKGIGWWITSALESNIGLNAIAQFTYTLDHSVPQGLGTGSLFTNNISCPLFVDQGALHYSKDGKWQDVEQFLN
ncbi:o-succinylbenzoate synthase [Lutimonas zeaxanthinifaciens]|uniref:o-succinylbenzoate synthase n=1 Tax=Lutimonas zeaxanthinifaciens TaxID=3060215 RepID=UPI00265D5167|nr:o-succinylbenzoate synthase [Lutimonas sp. YSD2104]WKK67589.1 o-succinylbenzoate synthase [Lutimonas sp. YSD2104]